MKARIPFYGYIGFILIILFWYLNWHLDGLRTHLLFFPLWLGYCLLIDSLTYAVKGNSLITRDVRKYILLFLISIPVWWFFELVNGRTQNWYYLGRDQFSDIAYFFYASICFSTVIPAVFGTAELFASLPWIKRIRRGPRIPLNRTSLIVLFMLGLLTFVLLLLWPDIFYVFLWLSVFFILDSMNAASNRNSLIFHTDKRDWRPLIALALGSLTCGFFWEMWNYLAFPKWIYHTPGVEFLYVFEMPLLGYLGYIPFSFELFAFYSLVTSAWRHQSKLFYLDI